MCGIFGWFGENTEEDLSKMAQVLRHRGPDGEGYFHTEKAALGMTRLAILDHEGGGQPFVSEDENVVLVCNGEIYNFKELKKELEGYGHQFKTNNDVEVLPAAYLQWGEGFVEKLNGMFALALWEKSAETLLLVRDRCGQKPLYITESNGVYYFASELKAFWALGIEKVLHEEAIPTYLNLRYVPEPQTLFKSVEIIPAGHLWKSGEGKARQWWKAKITDSKPTDREELHHLVQSSVELALVSDEPIAVHLSAGVDSSVLLSEIHRQGTEVKALTATFGADSDELTGAAALAKKYGIEHHKVELNTESLSSLPQVVSQMELPVGDALIIAFDQLANATAQVGCKVALGGEGIDEIYGGYSFHKVMLLAEQMGKIGRTMIATGMGVTPKSILQRLSAFPAELGESGFKKVRQYFSQYDDLTDYEKGIELRTLFSSEDLSRHGMTLAKQAFSEQGSLFDQHITYQFRSWLQDWAIIRQERNTMAHSVEYRMPFLDHRLVEFGLNSHPTDKIRGLEGKAAWRAMAQQCYPEVMGKRVKQPFYFPVEERSYFDAVEEMVTDVLFSRTTRVTDFFPKGELDQLWKEVRESREFLPLKKIMALLILELWLKEHQL